MSELGFGAGGISEGLQLVQALQTGKVEQQQKQVALESSQIQLANMKKLQTTLGAHSFDLLGGGHGGVDTNGMMALANVYLANNMTEQAKSVVDMATNLATTKAYATEQQAAATKKYIDMAEDLFSGVSNAQEWRQAQMFMQSQLPPESLQNPVIKGLLTSEYSPDKVRIMPGFLDKLRLRAQTAAEQARSAQEDAHTKYYKFEADRDTAQAEEARSRADYYRRQGASDLIPNKAEIDVVAQELQAKYPEAETQPVVQGGKLTDPVAARSNYKSRIQARATEIAEAAKSYIKQGLSPADARRRALAEAEARGDLSTLKALPGSPQGATPPATQQPTRSSSEGWGEPTQVGQ